MSKKRQNYRTQADQAFSKFIRLRDGECAARVAKTCTPTLHLQCAHIVSRRYGSVRTNPSNAVALCRACHVFFTAHPIEWDEWVTDRFGEGYLMLLKHMALNGPRPDWKEEAAHWKARVKELADA